MILKASRPQYASLPASWRSENSMIHYWLPIFAVNKDWLLVAQRQARIITSRLWVQIVNRIEMFNGVSRHPFPLLIQHSHLLLVRIWADLRNRFFFFPFWDSLVQRFKYLCWRRFAIISATGTSGRILLSSVAPFKGYCSYSCLCFLWLTMHRSHGIIFISKAHLWLM